MHDEEVYPQPNSFRGARFVPGNPTGGPKSRLTDVSENFPVWGYGSLAWYVFLAYIFDPLTVYIVLEDFMQLWL
jgi:hypothetical protein